MVNYLSFEKPLSVIEGKIRELNELNLQDDKGKSYVEEINAFIEKINNGQECSPSISDGIEVLKMVNFIYSEK